MAYIGVCSPLMKPEIDDIEIAKGYIVATTRNEPDFDYGFQYLNQELTKDQTIYYSLVISFIVASLIIVKSKIEQRRKVKIYLRCSIFLLLNLAAIINLRWWVEQDYEQSFVKKTIFAARNVETLQYRPIKSHVPIRAIFDTAGKYNVQEINAAKEELTKYFDDKLQNTKRERSFWISEYFGERKLWALKSNK